SKTEEFLKKYSFLQLQPKHLTKLVSNITSTEKILDKEKWHLGLFLSILIQTSYNQGFNDFEFEEINADDFGSCLNGKNEDKIRIKAEKINGRNTLEYAEFCSLNAGTINGGGAGISAHNCYLEAETINGNSLFGGARDCSLNTKIINGDLAGHCSQNCFLTAEKIIGDYTLINAEKCTLQITNYNGNRFGEGMKSCMIYSPKVITLLKLGIQQPKRHIYKLGRYKPKE
ncbi:hypothetical protein HY643_02815, partial [Candidatus Woesearchaeota archaeon]|nr:hypothetical protein [Candidatus Woesearchaeota archaeon]